MFLALGALCMLKSVFSLRFILYFAISFVGAVAFHDIIAVLLCAILIVRSHLGHLILIDRCKAMPTTKPWAPHVVHMHDRFVECVLVAVRWRRERGKGRGEGRGGGPRGRKVKRVRACTEERRGGVLVPRDLRLPLGTMARVAVCLVLILTILLLLLLLLLLAAVVQWRAAIVLRVLVWVIRSGSALVHLKAGICTCVLGTTWHLQLYVLVCLYVPLLGRQEVAVPLPRTRALPSTRCEEQYILLQQRREDMLYMRRGLEERVRRRVPRVGDMLALVALACFGLLCLKLGWLRLPMLQLSLRWLLQRVLVLCRRVLGLGAREVEWIFGLDGTRTLLLGLSRLLLVLVHLLAPILPKGSLRREGCHLGAGMAVRLLNCRLEQVRRGRGQGYRGREQVRRDKGQILASCCARSWQRESTLVLVVVVPAIRSRGRKPV